MRFVRHDDDFYDVNYTECCTGSSEIVSDSSRLNARGELSFSRNVKGEAYGCVSGQHAGRRHRTAGNAAQLQVAGLDLRGINWLIEGYVVGEWAGQCEHSTHLRGCRNHL